MQKMGAAVKMSGSYTCNVVVDLEFTSVPRARRRGGLLREIIEIGAVKLAPDATVVGTFSHVVRPTLAKGVSGFVHNMTGIGDEDLLFARPLPEVLDAFRAWVGPGHVRMVTWSESDLIQITQECRAKGIEAALPHRWLNIQRLYPRLAGLPNRRLVALGEAADWCGIANRKDQAHRALYDAQMTAQIFGMMANGDCAEHRRRMEAELAAASQTNPCASSIAERCAGLADLLAGLVASEAAAMA